MCWEENSKQCMTNVFTTFGTAIKLEYMTANIV